jgi:GAF domain-containing protein
MSVFTQLPKQSDSFYQMDELRGKFLHRIMIFAAILGVVPVILGFFGTNNLFLQTIYIGVFLTLVSTIIFRLPYLLKARFFVVLPLVLGISSTVNAGSHGDNLFFFLSYVFLSALLLGLRSGLFAVAISEIIVITTGYLVLNQHFTLLDALAPKGGLQEWTTDSALLLLISLMVIAGLQMLQDGFKKANIQNKFKTEQLEESQKELDIRVSKQTLDLKYKTNLLNAALLTIHETATIQDLDRLLNRVVQLISEHFGCYHVGIYLMNQRGDYVTLQAASSVGGKNLLENGYRLRVGTEGIIGFVAAEKLSRISLDVKNDTLFFNSAELSETQSELSLPLIYRSKVIGVLDLQSSEADAFKYEDLDTFQTMADQIAVTIENTRLLSENQLVISQLETISNENTRQNWKTELSIDNPYFHYSAIGVRPAEKPVRLEGKNVLDIPIILRGQSIGNISLQRRSELHKWTAQEENVAKEVAAQAALALENIRLVERTQQRANREQAIASISARVRETLDLDTVLRITAREIQQALNLQEAEVRLIPQDESGSEKDFE